ncbi:hypothetical protein N7449_007095 [Penicillium cf. viridicatum]|uniref:Uncharacterized protein n=1 Tax=Penicillium cf. viridicatum TaxID=2972119 RepID=A0A9W9MB60_9EURO|nr:hypothetical protein N7449_007095 [Penicillium cf. viridicatum]
MWDSINLYAMVIAPNIEWAQDMGLTDSWDLPWNPKRKIYFLKVIHQLRCLDLICKADDPPMPSLELVNAVGGGQVLKCKNFDKLVAWAKHPDRDACYKRGNDYQPPLHSIDRYDLRPPGSEHFPIMSQYYKDRGYYVHSSE